MALSPGQKLGPYEVVGALGAGGMGEVYRARDSRLGRDVALKVLSPDLAGDADRRARFEQEARSASALNHPNIITIYDIGSADSIVFIAMELVEGRTLREQLQGALPLKRFLDIAGQIADGLAKAHAAGIVHRDLKPENVMISRDGLVKILDFGLAKLTLPDSPDRSDLATAVQHTRAGTVLGTVGYMSPEQASGQAVDFRSDQFSFGSILYEMATGRRAFQRGTTAETLTAIIREEAEPIAQANAAMPAPVRWVVERCLQKDPDERYASTRDLARDLRSVKERVSQVSDTGSVTAPAVRRRRTASWLRVALLCAALAAAGAVGALLQHRFSVTTPPSYQQITFGSGTIRSGRFAPDGQTIIFAAAWDGGPLKLFLKHPSSPDSLSIDLPSANLLSISPGGEMAIAVDCRSNHPGVCAGTLARAALTGGAPRDVAEGIQEADWAADGTTLLVVRDVGARSRIELPLGKLLYETSGHVTNARLSPTGDRIAFLDHPFPLDDAGTVAVIDLSGKKTTLTGTWASEQGLAWSPSGSEVWFTATEAGANRSLYGVSLSGKVRVVTRVPGGLRLLDIAQNGRVLLNRESRRVGILGVLDGDTHERDMSFLDYSFAADLSSDARLLLFDEEGEAGGANYTVYLRKSDRSPVVRLGEGNAMGLSPDGKWALAMIPAPGSPIRLLPTGAGEPKQLTLGAISPEQAATWLPDSRHVLFAGREPGHELRVYMQSAEGGAPQPITPEGISVALPGFAASPDGRLLAAVGPDRMGMLYAIPSGPARAFARLEPGEHPLRFSADGQSVFTWKRGEVPARVSRILLATGTREMWKDLLPADPAGVERISNVLVAPDGKGYAYCYTRMLSDLFVVEGLR